MFTSPTLVKNRRVDLGKGYIYYKNIHGLVPVENWTVVAVGKAPIKYLFRKAPRMRFTEL